MVWWKITGNIISDTHPWQMAYRRLAHAQVGTVRLVRRLEARARSADRRLQQLESKIIHIEDTIARALAS